MRVRANYLYLHLPAWHSIPSFHFTIPPDMDSVEIEIPAAKLTLNDKKLKYRIYQLSSPMAPGDSMVIKIRSRKETKGFENQVSFTSLTHNGTFFNNGDILPLLGYQSNYELQDKNKRRKMGLPARQKLPFSKN